MVGEGVAMYLDQKLDQKRAFLAGAVCLIMFPSLILVPSAVHDARWSIDLNIPLLGCYAIIGVSGMLAGYLYASIYGSRYYFFYMIGLFVGCLVGFGISCFVWREYTNHLKKGCGLASLAGFVPVLLLLLPGIKRIQDFVFPPAPEKLSEDVRTMKETESHLQSALDQWLEPKRRAGGLVPFLLPALIPPLGLLVNYIVYAWTRDKLGENRRNAVLGMWISAFSLILWLGAFSYILWLSANVP